MKRAHWAVLVAVVLCAAAAILWWRHGAGQAQPAKSRVSTQLPSAGAASADAPLTSESGPLPHHAASTAAPVDYAAGLRAASDYLEFIRSIQDAASNGDHAAQFYSYRALDYCYDGYRGYFKGRQGRLTLDDALKRSVSRWPFNPEDVRRVHARCHTLWESGAEEITERLEWLKLASDGGYPLAQVIAAQRQWQATAGEDNDDAARLEERRGLLAKAIRSREPEVIWEIGNNPLDFERRDGGELGEVKEYDVDYAAWWLAACARGLDCSPGSQVVGQLCRFDPGCQPYESVADILRRGSDDDFSGIEARARWISEKIDAGDWESLGF
jgi:hypothetical protein